MHANCWILALSFLLGLILTFAFTVRRVTREVPEAAPNGATATRGKDTAAAASADTATAKLATPAAPSEEKTAKITISSGDRPYGAGSAKAGAGGSGPDGWTIKGNEDSMLYHDPESPSYDATIAEVWFKDAKTAEAAGFARWDSRTDKK